MANLATSSFHFCEIGEKEITPEPVGNGIKMGDGSLPTTEIAKEFTHYNLTKIIFEIYFLFCFVRLN